MSKTKTATRIYTVAPAAGGPRRLVRATHPANALRHVAADSFTVQVTGQEELVELLGAGVPVESIRAEQQPLPVDGE